jgi:hypothetical protein
MEVIMTRFYQIFILPTLVSFGIVLVILAAGSFVAWEFPLFSLNPATWDGWSRFAFLVVWVMLILGRWGHGEIEKMTNEEKLRTEV